MKIKKQYSKKERNEIYRKAHENYDAFLDKQRLTVLGACEAIQSVLTGGIWGCDEIVTTETFPELFLFKDANWILWLDYDVEISEFSFYGFEEKRINMRKTVLMFCEEMTRG